LENNFNWPLQYMCPKDSILEKHDDRSSMLVGE